MACSTDGSGGCATSGEEPAIPFPFEPYDVQKQLMSKIYATLEKGGIGIFESPTGTGKSLSVICSALQWLKDVEAKQVDGRGPERNGGLSQREGSKVDANGNAVGDEDDDDRDKGGDDGEGGEGSALPSWLTDLTRQKSENAEQEKMKRIRSRRRDLEERLESFRKNQGQGKGVGSNFQKRRAAVRHWASPSGGARSGNLPRGASRKRPRPKHASFLENQGKAAAATRRVMSGRDGPGAAPPDGEHVSGSTEAGVGDEGDDDGEDEFLVAEYHSGEEGGGGAREDGRESSDEDDADDNKNAGAKAGEEEELDEEWRDLGLQQILYVSRTHSQTSQFVNEVKKTAFAHGVRCASLGSRRTLCGHERVSSLKTDAKMRDACLELQKNKREKNKDKKRKRGKDKDKDKDKDKGVQKKEEELESDGCPLLAAEGQREFPYRALAEVRDIEELAELGKQEGTCAYYGARKAAALAQLVVMPYAALLSREARDAMGVRLEGAAVVVDEAHNIVEAINSVHSKRIVLSEVVRAHSQLSQYEAKYGARLKGSNANYVRNILKVLQAMLKFLSRGKKTLQDVRRREKAGYGEAEEGARSDMLEINDFLFRTGLDNVNLFKLQRYMRRSEISRKVMGFVEVAEACSPQVTLQQKPWVSANGQSNRGFSNAAEAVSSSSAPGGESGGSVAGAGENSSGAFVSKNVSALQVVEGFLDALTNASRDGRVLATYGGKDGVASSGSSSTVSRFADGSGAGGAKRGVGVAQRQNQPQQQQQDEEEPSLKFLMLNPSVHFDEIVQKARALVLVGGTMQPTGDIVRQLFSSVDRSRLDVFSCGHVIPRENLLPLCVSRGPTGKRFNFTFLQRGTDEQLDELGGLMYNVCNIVRAGVVCFLPSYGYLDQVLRRWKTSGTIGQLSKRKSVFSEPRSAKDVDGVLRDFSLAARAGAWTPNSSGGGGRGGSGGGSNGGALLMAVVGAKMSEGINFSDDLARCVVMVGLPYPDKRDAELKQKMAYLDEASPGSRGQAGREYYSSICMRAVNQSIGRSIRHAKDYASILLIDERYKDEKVVRMLPGWIAERVQKPENFGKCVVALRKFFNTMHAS